jgi:nucleoside recognition membrane protein YjiH
MNALTIYLILVFISFLLAVIMFYITNKLSNAPKPNKFRQWWSKHIVDLDGKYKE